MCWLWSSFDACADRIAPRWVKLADFKLAQRNATWENIQNLHRAFSIFDECLSHLMEADFDNDPLPMDAGVFSELLSACERLSLNGEKILLLHNRLAVSHWTDDFIHEKDLDEHWEHYRQSERIFRKIKELVAAAQKLRDGFCRIAADDEQFLVGNLSMPPELESHFVRARNLFSVGFDEAGFLFAGRGLEATLRAFAKKKELRFGQGAKEKPANEADLRDIIEIFSRARWRSDKSLIIDISTRNLLHLLRSTRNAVAHPTTQKTETSWRELAHVATRSAAALWKDAVRKRAV